LSWWKRLNAALIALCWFAGLSCAHYPVDESLLHYDPAGGYRFEALQAGKNTDSLFVCLSFSGGGTRAAALAYGVMTKIKDVPIKWKGVEKRLLDEVDCITSVSGGSFTAAYYALFRDRLFADFRPRFLEEDIEQQLLWRVLNPINWFRLASPYFSRIDLAAEFYDERIFDEKTYADLLAQAHRPFLILNATNLANGERFEFTQHQFDFLGSDLERFPVARAVAASSAFPFLLSPITLQNHPSPKNYEVPKEYREALADFDLNRRRYIWARNQTRYLDKANYPYLHLMDGGLADNIGLRAVINAHQRSNGFIRKLINDGKIEKLVLIVVNAGTDPQEDMSRHESPPGLFTIAYRTATISLDNFSTETIEFMKGLVEERAKAQQRLMACQRWLAQCPAGPTLPTFASVIDSYVVDVNFQSIREDDRRRFFLNLPTGFVLCPDEVQQLIEAGRELLEQSEEFAALLKALQ
jgi:NTE family protein